jgi:hypothetical protein
MTRMHELIRIALGKKADDTRRWAFLFTFADGMKERLSNWEADPAELRQYAPFERSLRLVEEAFPLPATAPVGAASSTAFDPAARDKHLQQFVERERSSSKFERGGRKPANETPPAAVGSAGDKRSGSTTYLGCDAEALLHLNSIPRSDPCRLKEFIRQLYALDRGVPRLLDRRRTLRLAGLLDVLSGNGPIETALRREITIVCLEACRRRHAGRAVGLSGRLQALLDGAIAYRSRFRAPIQAALKSLRSTE